MYYLLYTFAYLHALLPFRVLYILSDILYFFTYKVVGYRRKIVRQNLLLAFPDKTQEERTEIEQRFYRHFCDYIVETIKLAHISDEEMKRRMVFRNLEEVEKYMGDENSCITLLGHYGNWEWITSISLFLNKELVAGQIYHPLRNKSFDRLMLKLRSRFRSVSIPMRGTFREILKMRRGKVQSILGFIADQRPKRNAIEYYTTFFGQQTPVINGFERIAVQTGFIVVYLDVRKIKRGFYEATAKLIALDPKKCEQFEITEKYIREMEQTILRDPAYWLWTHKRWKY